MKARELNAHLDRAGSSLDVHEQAMADAVATAIIEAADEAARNFKRNATDFLAADGAPTMWAIPDPDEVIDERKLAAKIERAVQPILDAAFDAYLAELPTCIPLEAAQNSAVMADVARQVNASAQQDELRQLAEEARSYDGGFDVFL